MYSSKDWVRMLLIRLSQEEILFNIAQAIRNNCSNLTRRTMNRRFLHDKFKWGTSGSYLNLTVDRMCHMAFLQVPRPFVPTYTRCSSSVTRKKSPNVYKSCPKIISLEQWYVVTPLRKLPKNEEDLGKLIVTKGFKSGPKSNKSLNLVTLCSSYIKPRKNG